MGGKERFTSGGPEPGGGGGQGAWARRRPGRRGGHPRSRRAAILPFVSRGPGRVRSAAESFRGGGGTFEASLEAGRGRVRARLPGEAAGAIRTPTPASLTGRASVVVYPTFQRCGVRRRGASAGAGRHGAWTDGGAPT